MPPSVKPLPRDEERFKHLSHEPPAKLPPDFKLPSGEEMARQTLERMAEVRKRHDGNEEPTMSTETNDPVLSIEDTAFVEPGPGSPHPPATIFGSDEELPKDELARRVEQHAAGMHKRT